MVRIAPRNLGKYTVTCKSKPLKRTHRRPPPARTMMTRSQCDSSGSFFQRLPSELFEMILDKLSVVEISVFSMVSKEITKCIVPYISTLAWKNKMIIRSFHHSTCLKQRSHVGHYRDLGVLFKRCTLLLPTKDRLKFIFSRFAQISCFTMDHCLSPDCTGFSSYGVFIQTLIAGWDQLECQRVFNFLCNHTNLLSKIEAVVTGMPGVRRHQELQVRLFCRQVLLDPWANKNDYQFWLALLLKPWALVSQARLLFILFGPYLPEGTLAWQDLVEREQPRSALWDLARAIVLLSDKEEVNNQTSNSILAIMEELFAVPQPWHPENVARLMMLCGSNLCFTILASKAVNGRVPELSRLIVHTILVCEKDGYQVYMSWVVQLVQQICNVFGTASKKLRFIHHLESMFSEVIKEIFDNAVAGNLLEERETVQSLCLLLDASAHFHAALLHVFLK